MLQSTIRTILFKRTENLIFAQDETQFRTTRLKFEMEFKKSRESVKKLNKKERKNMLTVSQFDPFLQNPLCQRKSQRKGLLSTLVSFYVLRIKIKHQFGDIGPTYN